MLTGARRRGLVWLLCLGQLGAACAPPRERPVFGYAEIGGRPAVYAPLCAGDEVAEVRVYAAPDRGSGGDFTLVWQAAGPTSDTVRGGLFVLGDGGQFATVATAPPETFPRQLSVAVDTVRGRSVEDRRERPATLPRYEPGTAAAEMTFDTDRGSMAYRDLRRLVENRPGCS
jgi:hypothetical protein